ncbi:MAG: ribosome maturation factor RimM [Candidatus Onthomonas sp.]|nr:ribosome maturation factor RimM [Candidatus Onthomonas sp.]
MQANYLEVGKILNTHGVRGELKVQPWLDSPLLFQQLPALSVNGQTYTIRSVRSQGPNVLVMLEGIDSIDDALPLKGKIASARREDIPLEEGRHFVADLIGLKAKNADTGAFFGTVTEISEYPAHDVYVVQGEKTYLIPDVPAFVREINVEEGFIAFTILEGMEQ